MISKHLYAGRKAHGTCSVTVHSGRGGRGGCPAFVFIRGSKSSRRPTCAAIESHNASVSSRHHSGPSVAAIEGVRYRRYAQSEASGP
jgi:hypothetical protein